MCRSKLNLQPSFKHETLIYNAVCEIDAGPAGKNSEGLVNNVSFRSCSLLTFSTGSHSDLSCILFFCYLFLPAGIVSCETKGSHVSIATM